MSSVCVGIWQIEKAGHTTRRLGESALPQDMCAPAPSNKVPPDTTLGASAGLVAAEKRNEINVAKGSRDNEVLDLAFRSCLAARHIHHDVVVVEGDCVPAEL